MLVNIVFIGLFVKGVAAIKDQTMIRHLFALALLIASPSLAAQEQSAPLPQLSLEHRMLLRCSAAFSIVSFGQDNGNAEALAWPDLSERGKQFFLRSTAQVMDEAGLDRKQISAALSAEAQSLLDADMLARVMPPCLALLPSN